MVQQIMGSGFMRTGLSLAFPTLAAVFLFPIGKRMGSGAPDSLWQQV
jgi:hypothetical protein